MTDQLAIPIPATREAPSRKAFDHIVAHNAELIRERHRIHAQMLETGAALAAWAASFPEGVTPDDQRDAALLAYFNENWSRP